MKFFRKIISFQGFWSLLLVIFFSVLASYPLFTKGYFNMHDDLQMMRQLQMEKCFLDGQIPCRWVPDMGYGYGFPLFNFYPPLPYLVGQVIRVLGFDFVSTAKALFIIAFIASGVTMYYLGKEFFGKWGGMLAAIFYVWAPYHAVDIYVRGAMNESWALICFPLILWTSYRLIMEKKRIFIWVVGLALGWFALLTSHNLMVLIFSLPFALWCALWLLRSKSWRKVLILAVSGIWALGLAAFFTLPATLENKFTQIDSVLVGYYDYSGHFVNIDQLLISRFWGYGPSVWLENDGMSFQIGHLHWLLSLAIGLITVAKCLKNKKVDDQSRVIILFLVIGWLAAFLTHAKSTPIWLAIPPLRYLQFPWRALTLVTLSFSLLVGIIPTLIKKRFSLIFSIILVIVLVIFNWQYFKPQNGRMGPLTDQEKFSAAAWDLQQTAGIYDYLPIWAKTAPKSPQRSVAENARGLANITEASQNTRDLKFKVEVVDDKASIRVNTFYFPGWVAFANGKRIETRVPDEEEWGRMWVDLTKGKYDVELRFENTSIRTVSNFVSLISWVMLLSSPLWFKRVKL